MLLSVAHKRRKGRIAGWRRRRRVVLDLKPCGNATYFLPSDGDSSGGGPASSAGILKFFFIFNGCQKLEGGLRSDRQNMLIV